MSSILNSDIFSRWAEKQTGRLPTPALRTFRVKGLIVPEQLRFRDLKVGGDTETYQKRLTLPQPSFLSLSGWLILFAYLKNLGRLLFMAEAVDIFMVPGSDNRLLMWLTAILTRLRGRFLILHDFNFYPERRIDKISSLRRLADLLVFGDHCLVPEQIESSDKTALHREECPEGYDSFRKNIPVPRVLVFGDFETRSVRALISNAHDLIKQKYPRTEFILVNLLDGQRWPPENHNNSIRMETPENEKDLAALFKDADIMLLVSPGGLNPIFVSRSRGAGFPIITNGFLLSSNNPPPVVVPRDSYNTIADEIIRMVDDENYYRQCRDL